MKVWDRTRRTYVDIDSAESLLARLNIRKPEDLEVSDAEYRAAQELTINPFFDNGCPCEDTECEG